MGCIFNKNVDRSELTLSPNSQRQHMLKSALQNSRSVKYTGLPEFTSEEQAKIIESSKEFTDHMDTSADMNQFTDMITKHNQIFHLYFKNVPSDIQSNSGELEEETLLTRTEFSRHLQMSTTMVKNSIANMFQENPAILEEALRRIGSIHAETWVFSKDLLFFEESFMWSVDKFDPLMNPKLRALWRKAIKFIVHNIVIGVNNHYQKLSFVLGKEKGNFFTCLDTPLPQGVDPRSHDSLRKLAAHIAALED